MQKALEEARCAVCDDEAEEARQEARQGSRSSGRLDAMTPKVYDETHRRGERATTETTGRVRMGTAVQSTRVGRKVRLWMTQDAPI